MSQPPRFPKWLLALGGLAGLGLLLYLLRGVLSPIFFAFLIAYLLDPVVDRLEKRRVPRALAIVIVLALTLGAIAAVVLLIVPGVVREVVLFARELPAKLAPLRDRLEPWLGAHGVQVPHSVDEWLHLLEEQSEGMETSAIAGRAASVLGAIGRWLLGGTDTLLALISSALIVPVFAFYLLYDFDRMVTGIRDLVPWRYRPFVVDVTKEVDAVLGQFVRGQLLVMLALAVLYAVAYSLVGVRLAIPIGIVAGLVSFIPYVGGAVALVLALLMCLLSWQGWDQIALVVGAYTVIQLLEGFVITPRIVGDKVGLPAIWVLVALMIGGELFGFLGVLLALPAAAVGKIFVVRALATYRKSALYRDGGPAIAERPLAKILEEEGLPDDAATAAAKSAAQHGDRFDDEVDAAFDASTRASIDLSDDLRPATARRGPLSSAPRSAGAAAKSDDAALASIDPIVHDVSLPARQASERPAAQSINDAVIDSIAPGPPDDDGEDHDEDEDDEAAADDFDDEEDRP